MGEVGVVMMGIGLVLLLIALFNKMQTDKAVRLGGITAIVGATLVLGAIIVKVAS